VSTAGGTAEAGTAGTGPADPWPPPAPGEAPAARRVIAQARFEAGMTLRNGEQFVLTLVIPVLLLAGFSLEPLVKEGSSRVNFLVPGMIALAVMSTAFTSQAIATGFERRYGVLKRLGATPLGRGGLITAKTLTVVALEAAQTVIICVVGLLLGWRPHASPVAVLWVLLLVLTGTAAFSGLGLLLAGTLRAEATLAVANLAYLVMLGLGGIIFPLTKFPAAWRPILTLLPPGALSQGLRGVLQHTVTLPLGDIGVLAVWAVASIAVASRTFRWE